MLEDDDLDTGEELPINAFLELTNESLTNKLRATKQTPQLAFTRSSDCHFRLHFSFSDLQLGATFATADLPVPRHGAFHPITIHNKRRGLEYDLRQFFALRSKIGKILSNRGFLSR